MRKFIVLLTISLFSRALQGCGSRDEPNYYSSQGLSVYDPLGLSNAKDTSLLVQCFDDQVMPEASTDYTQLHLRLIASDDIDECNGGANTGGCTFRGDYAYVRWTGDYNENAAAHELLHMADWHGSCGNDPQHICGRWSRIYDAQSCYLAGRVPNAQ